MKSVKLDKNKNRYLRNNMIKKISGETEGAMDI